jgi:hypothetical protein
MSDNEAPPRLDILITLIAITILNIFLIFDCVDSRKKIKNLEKEVSSLKLINGIHDAANGF